MSLSQTNETRVSTESAELFIQFDSGDRSGYSTTVDVANTISLMASPIENETWNIIPQRNESTESTERVIESPGQEIERQHVEGSAVTVVNFTNLSPNRSMSSNQSYQRTPRNSANTHALRFTDLSVDNSTVTYANKDIIINNGDLKINNGKLILNNGSIFIHVRDLHNNNGNLFVNGGDIVVNKGNVHANNGHLHVKDGSIVVNRGDVNMNNGSIRVIDGDLTVEKGDIKINNGVLQIDKGDMFAGGSITNNNGSIIINS